jgi:hypothetical protein
MLTEDVKAVDVYQEVVAYVALVYYAFTLTVIIIDEVRIIILNPVTRSYTTQWKHAD